MKPDQDEQVMAKLAELQARLREDRERSILDVLLAPFPASPTFKWEETKADLAEDVNAFRFRVSLPVLFSSPRHMVHLAFGREAPELRCGPFGPPGKQWAVVKSRETGRRSVVNWPIAPRRPLSLLECTS